MNCLAAVICVWINSQQLTVTKLACTSQGLHDREDVLGPLEGSDGRVDAREVSLPDPLTDGPHRCQLWVRLLTRQAERFVKTDPMSFVYI